MAMAAMARGFHRRKLEEESSTRSNRPARQKDRQTDITNLRSHETQKYRDFLAYVGDGY